MSYFAAVIARTSTGWIAQELDLDYVETIDDVAELVRDADEAATTALLFVEEDDEYVGIVRLDGADDDPRVFLSDGSAADEYDLAGILADGLTEDEDEPVGDPGLCADLGTSARDLLALVHHEGTLPSDVITAVCEKAGCLDVLEGLRVG
ncbi:MAG TPA: tRNA adenosine deaminase-associated protein [Mycobacteriales bacterium]|nr:tRNA adenosine deaminase-associated protein [Mycobacteriales bacterium]